MNGRYRFEGFHVAAAIVAVAVIIVVGALIGTRPGADAGDAARIAAEAQRAGRDTPGPAAGRTGLIPPRQAQAPGVDVSSACRSIALGAGTNPNARIDPFVSRANPAVNITGGPIKTNEDYRLMGWAVSEDGTAPLRAVCLVVDGKIVPRATVLYGFDRPDVAGSYHRDSLTPCGFEIDIPSGVIARGRHRIEVASVSPAGVRLLPGVRDVTAD